MSIQFTSSALHHVRQRGGCLRLVVKSGGCKGLSYAFFAEDTRSSNDCAFTQDEATVIIDAASLPFVSGSTIDYQNEMASSGFILIPPTDTRSCGCGHSFST